MSPALAPKPRTRTTTPKRSGGATVAAETRGLSPTAREPKPSRTRRQPEDRKLEIVSAAYDIFAEHGYHDATVDQIAKRVGISKGTFYLYFESKLAIFDYLVNDKLALLLVEANAGEDPARIHRLEDHLAAVRRVSERLVDVFLGDPQLAQLMFFGSIGISPELRESVDRAMDFAAGLTERYFRNGVEKGFLRAGLDTRALSHGINALIAVAGRRICASPAPHETARTLVDLFMTLIHDGVAAPEAATAKPRHSKSPATPKAATANPRHSASPATPKAATAEPRHRKSPAPPKAATRQRPK